MSSGNFVAKAKSNTGLYPIAPVDSYPAVLVDVVRDEASEERYKATAIKKGWEKKESGIHVKLVFQLRATITEADLEAASERQGQAITEKDLELIGKRFTVSQSFPLSFATFPKKSRLREFVEAWRGIAFPKNEDNYDIETLLGANAIINVKHALSADGKNTFANIGTISPLTTNMKKLFEMNSLLEPLNYTRVQDRVQQNGNGAVANSVVTEDVTE
jgi:hypothetical protein